MNISPDEHKAEREIGLPRCVGCGGIVGIAQVDDRIMCSCTVHKGPILTRPHNRKCVSRRIVNTLPYLCGGKMTLQLAKFGWRAVCEHACENPSGELGPI